MRKMNSRKRLLVFSLTLLIPVFVAGCGSSLETRGAPDVGSEGIPSFEVDPSWPLEMPNDWIMGSVTAVFVDAMDHVWVTHLPETLTPEETSAVQDPPIGMCCVPAPIVIEFDESGNVVQGWGIRRHKTCQSSHEMRMDFLSTTTTSSGSGVTNITG